MNYTIPVAGMGAVRTTQKQKYVDPAAIRYNNFKMAIAWHLRNLHKGEPLTGPIMLKLDFYMPIPPSWKKDKQAQAVRGEIRPTSKPDWDNLEKGLSDAANGIVWKDDAQVIDCHTRLWYSVSPRIEMSVEVWEYDEQRVNNFSDETWSNPFERGEDE